VINSANKWELAPAFDLAYSYKPGSPWVESHQMSINGKRDNFTKQDLLGVVPPSLQGEAEAILSEVHATVTTWREIARDVGVEPSFLDEIESNHRLNLV
ncbi:type II toxin-antitoxin system HipA family toxin, partial [Vibrio sp. 10N.261.45.F1]